MAIDIIVCGVTVGLGAAIGGVPGAMLGEGIAPVVSKYGALVSIRADAYDIKSIKKLAVLRNKLTRHSRIEAYKRPHYYL